MKTAKRIAEILLIAALAAVICLGVLNTGAASDDPANSYVKQKAPYEDSSISMWFDYSFHKTFTSDHTSTGKNTFSIYMAKNEIESAQFVLYSAADKTQLQAEVTDFTDGRGNTVPAEIYYEMYVTTSNLNTRTVLGTNQIIREGETPDPVMEISRLGTTSKPAYFKLNAGKSQAFLIRAKSSETTPAGWYSAQLNIKNSSGQIIKTATVYCHVWDFVISEETRLQTAFIMNPNFEYGGSYKEAYDYLLENRLNAMDVPGGKLTSTNPYLTNPRVAAVRVTGEGGGYSGQYSDTTAGQMANYPSIYNDLSTSPIWDEIKDKLYFYSVDEPLPYPLVGTGRQTVDDLKSLYPMAQSRWGEDIKFVVTPCEDFPYSEKDKYYTKPMQQYAQEEIKDADQEMIDTNTVTVFCPRIYGLTPYSELQAYFKSVGRANNLSIENYDCIRGESITQYSGCYGTYGAANIASPYDWNAHYGDTFDRYMSHIINMNNKGTYGSKYELWMYSAGYNKSYTYANHIVENTGLQTKLLFWQAYQNDVTGYLYYAVNGWGEQDPRPLDKTVTGSKTGSWPLNTCTISVPDYDKGVYVSKQFYGGGVLFYGKQNARTTSDGIVGSLRVEILRDSVEEYQMLSMLGDLKGKDRAKAHVARVSTNVVRYLSLSGFNRSMWASSVSDDDIMEAVRRDLGAELEAAVHQTQCAHSWNSGTVTKAATCKAMGTKTYTCTKCSAKRTEYIPTLHEEGSCFTVISSVAATCTSDGKQVCKCKTCGFKKTVTVSAFHNDSTKLVNTAVDTNGHSVTCSVCRKTIVSLEKHTSFTRKTEATCTSDGALNNVCRRCGYSEKISTIASPGHNYVDGYCTVCGEKDTTVTVIPGDIDSDGKINAKDVNLLKQIVLGKAMKTPASDVDGDGKVTGGDVLLLKSIAMSAK